MSVRGLSSRHRRQSSFWTQPRPIKTSHAETRPRTRSRSMTFVETAGVKSGVPYEVENFWIYGDLRKTETQVRNTLPSAMTIQTEKTLHCFEDQRKATPLEADYSHFYRCLSASVIPNPSSNCSSTGSSPQLLPQQQQQATPTRTAADGAAKNNAHAVGDGGGAGSGQYLKVQSVPAYLQK